MIHKKLLAHDVRRHSVRAPGPGIVRRQTMAGPLRLRDAAGASSAHLPAARLLQATADIPEGLLYLEVLCTEYIWYYKLSLS